MPAVPELDPAGPAVPDTFTGSELAGWFDAAPGARHIGERWRTDPLQVLVVQDFDRHAWSFRALRDVWPHLDRSHLAILVAPAYVVEMLAWHHDPEAVQLAWCAHDEPHTLAMLAGAVARVGSPDYESCLADAEEVHDALHDRALPGADPVAARYAWARIYDRVVDEDTDRADAAELATRLLAQRS